MLFSVFFLIYFRIVYIWPSTIVLMKKLVYYYFPHSKRVALCSKFDILDSCPTEAPIKLLLSVCLPVHEQFGIFIRNGLLVFSEFLHHVRALFSRKIHFSPNVAKISQTSPKIAIFRFFWKILSLVFLEMI